MSPEMKPKKKLLHIEAARFLCIFLVMFTHTSTEGFSLYLARQDSPWFPLYLMVPFWIKTAVPIFFMISGALLLGRDEPLSVIFRKRVSRFAIVLLLFSFINYILAYSHMQPGELLALLPHPLGLTYYVLSHISFGQYLFITYTATMATAYYFLYIYIAFLLMLPFWRAMVRRLTNKDYLYLIALNLTFVGVIPIVSYLIFKGSANMNYFLNPLLAISEPTFYFIIGYWIEHVLPASWLTKRNLALLGAAALLGTIISGAMTVYHGEVNGALTEAISERFYDSFLFLNVAFVYALLRWWFLHHEVSHGTGRVLIFLGSVAFGIMLFDDFLRRMTYGLFHNIILPAMPDFPLTAAFLWIICAFSAGIVLSYLIRLIPGMKKLI